jgi:hypothetical protein
LVKLARTLLLALMEDLVGQRARDGGGWIRATAAGAAEAEAFVAAFSAASRHTGRSALNLRPDEAIRLRDLGVTWSLGRWALDDLARAALLLRTGEALGVPGLEAVVHRAYHDGDTRQRQAILRALALLPEPDRFLGVAVEAARSALPPLFEAIACENPYPAAHFPSLNFDHMVLQALVTGVSLDRVVGLGARVTPELIRRANDYAAERRAAGRSVPADVEYLTEATRIVAA